MQGRRLAVPDGWDLLLQLVLHSPFVTAELDSNLIGSDELLDVN